MYTNLSGYFPQYVLLVLTLTHLLFLLFLGGISFLLLSPCLGYLLHASFTRGYGFIHMLFPISFFATTVSFIAWYILFASFVFFAISISIFPSLVIIYLFDLCFYDSLHLFCESVWCRQYNFYSTHSLGVVSFFPSYYVLSCLVLYWKADDFSSFICTCLLTVP